MGCGRRSRGTKDFLPRILYAMKVPTVVHYGTCIFVVVSLQYFDLR